MQHSSEGTPRETDRPSTLEQRKAVQVEAIQQTHGLSEEDARATIDGLDETGRWYIKAFATLSRTRATESQLAPISLEEMTVHIETQDIPVEADEFVEVIQAMDSAWMAMNGHE